jgi:hypothetical protein
MHLLLVARLERGFHDARTRIVERHFQGLCVDDGRILSEGRAGSGGEREEYEGDE